MELNMQQLESRKYSMGVIQSGALLRMAYLDTNPRQDGEDEVEYSSRIARLVAEDANLANLIIGVHCGQVDEPGE